MSESNKNNLPVYNGQVNNEEEQSLQLADLWALVWDNKWWYVACILAALFAATFYLYKTPKTYSRTEKVIVDEDSQNSMMRDLTAFTNSPRPPPPPPPPPPIYHRHQRGQRNRGPERSRPDAKGGHPPGA